jgi:hypothetical protein
MDLDGLQELVRAGRYHEALDEASRLSGPVPDGYGQYVVQSLVTEALDGLGYHAVAAGFAGATAADAAKRLGNDHFVVVQASSDEIVFLTRAGLYAEAIDRGLRLVAAATQTLGSDHPRTLTVEVALARARFEDSHVELTQDEADALVDRWTWADPDEVTDGRLAAEELAAQVRLEAAERQADQVLDAFCARKGPEHPLTVQALGRLGP